MSEHAPEFPKGAAFDAEEDTDLAHEAAPGPTEDTVGLYLREIARVPLLTAAEEVSLAKALERGDVRPIGARHSFKVDVRIIAASNLPLRDMVAAGHFLPALHQALAAVQVNVPPLRERAGDLPALARHFLARIGEQPGLRPLGITDGALAPTNFPRRQASEFSPRSVGVGAVLHELGGQDQAGEEGPTGAEERRRLRWKGG